MGNLYCPKCGVVAAIKLHTDDMQTLECDDCGQTFGCDDVRAMLESAKKWEKLLKWIGTAPTEAK